MAITPIDVVIDPPLPTDAPSIFDQKAFAAWAAINGWADQANALAEQVNTDADRVNDPSVQAVADNIANVVAVDNNKANIDAVKNNATNINAVAGNSTNINAVNANKANIDTVAGISANVTTVATNNANVTAVAGNATNINAVAGNATNINAVNANKANIDTVAAIDADVDTVAGIAANVMAVAAIDDEVTAVAGNATNINAVHANKANIDAVAGNATNINAVNANKTNIDAVKNNATNINAVAGNKANIDTVAGKAADVTTVATNSTNVTTVATNITAVNTAATNMAAIIAAPGAASAAEGFKDTAEAAAAAAQAAAGLPAIAGKAGAALVVNEAETGVKYALPLSAPAITGPVSIEPNAEQAYTITNHSSFADYVVQISEGTVSMSGATITVTAPSEAGDITLTVTVNGLPTAFSIEVLSPYIETPAPTPANLLDPFEGGYYMGLYWDELLQSPTETEIATGAKTFSVPDMTVPTTYIGHQLEIRSRANPANKMTATVTAASLSAKTIDMNVTAVEGSGTFSDWSIMTQYRSIDAPKSSGEFASIRLKNTNTAFPVECQTLTDGWKATLAMVAAGDATEYPAAHAVRALTIGGFDDWHIPARDVLELRWRNGKPVTNNNYISGTRAFSAIDYGTNGNYGDQSGDARGLNRNSAPAGAAYTATVPAQTGVALFQQGGAEAYEFGSAYYWSCTEYSETNAWNQNWLSSSPGFQNSNSKSNNLRLRAVRRSIV